MEVYRISQSRKGVSQAYLQLMNKISSHVTLLAENGKPISSLMGIKRGLFRFKRSLCNQVLQLESGPSTPPSTPLRVTAEINEELLLLIGDVLDKLGLDVLEAVEVGLIGERDLKRVLIKYDYGQMVRKGIKHKVIKQQLGEQYGWSVSSIEKLVYRSPSTSLRVTGKQDPSTSPSTPLGMTLLRVTKGK